MLDRYAAAIEAVHNAATTYRLAVETLTDAEEAWEYEKAAVVADEQAQTYINAPDKDGKAPTAPVKEQRTTLWLRDYRGPQQEAVRTAKLAKLDAEYAYDYAKRLCRLEELRVRYLGGDDLLSDEPKGLPADPRRRPFAVNITSTDTVPAPWREGDPAPSNATLLFEPLDTDSLERVDR